jgi:hypothetical protein
MIKKCDHPDCAKVGTCRAPKSRDLKDYWFFCAEHAAEYNKNWNFYANMTPEEIEADWESQTFGQPLKDKDAANKKAKDYADFVNDFLTGRARFDHADKLEKSPVPSGIVAALKIFDLPISATWREVGVKYRAMAKQLHPDIAKDKKNAAAEFAKLAEAYKKLQGYYKK